MKGIIFRKFLDMIETEFGYEMVDELIRITKLESDGVYTSVGTYDYRELNQLVGALSKKTKIPSFEILKKYGIYVFSIFRKKYPHFFKEISNAFSFLTNVQEKIHVEVLKLYPEAELPTFQIEYQEGDNKMIMAYSSERKLGDFAEGLMIGCINHFNEKITINKDYLTKDRSRIRFTLTKHL